MELAFALDIIAILIAIGAWAMPDVYERLIAFKKYSNIRVFLIRKLEFRVKYKEMKV